MALSEIGEHMEAKRERRRRDIQRMKAKAARIGKQIGMPGQWRKAYNHLAVCSRACCGNPRRSFWHSSEEQKTLQERRFAAEAIDPYREPFPQHRIPIDHEERSRR